MSIISEFKEFAIKGNMIDMAIGIIIGGAFGKIVDSVVNDLIMPIIGRIIGGVDFTNLYVVLGNNPNNITALADLKKAGIATFAYGNFITILVNFIILAFIIFMMVRGINKLKRETPAEVVADPADVALLKEIRDLLKK